MQNDKKYETDNLAESDLAMFDENPADEIQQADNSKKKDHKIILFIFSFLMAMGIWLYVMGMEDIDYEKTLNLVPVQIVGTQELERNNNMSVISGYDNTVTVTLKGKRTDVDKYSANDIYAYVDVSKIDNSERQLLQVNVDSLPDVAVTLVTPNDIVVYADVIDTVKVSVTVKAQYTIDGGYYIDDSKISKNIDEIRVTGPVSVLNTIKSAIAEINIGKVTGSLKSSTTIYLVDENGSRIQNPYLRPDEDLVEITIPVFMRKSVALTYTYDAVAFADYELVVNMDIDSIPVSGEALVMSSINDINLFSLKPSHLRYDSDGNLEPVQTRTFDIILPNGVTNESEYTQVKVDFIITKKTPAVTEPQGPETPSTEQPDGSETTQPS